jgi:hypothetical protein
MAMAAWATTEGTEAGTAAEGTAGTGTAGWHRYGGDYGYSGGYWGSNGAWIPWAVGGALLGGAIAAGSQCPGRGALRVIERGRAVLGEADVGLEADDRRGPEDDVDLHRQVPVHLVALAPADDVLVRPAAGGGDIRDFVVRDEAARKIEGRAGRCREFLQSAPKQVGLDVLAEKGRRRLPRRIPDRRRRVGDRALQERVEADVRAHRERERRRQARLDLRHRRQRNYVAVEHGVRDAGILHRRRYLRISRETPFCANGVDGIFLCWRKRRCASVAREIDQSLSIVLETAQNPNCAIFPLKSKARKFDGPPLGLGLSEENICALNSAGYDSRKPSSGSEGSIVE